jgi:hypothetical protein
VTGALRAGDRAPDGVLTRAGQTTPSRLYDLLTGTRHTLLLWAAQPDNARVRQVRTLVGQWPHLFAVQRIVSVTAGRDTNGMADSVADGTGAASAPIWRDVGGALAARYGIGAAGGLAVIRPDGYIAVRRRGIATQPLRRYLRALSLLDHVP